MSDEQGLPVDPDAVDDVLEPRRRLGRVLATLAGVTATWGGAVATNRALRAVDGPSMLPLLAVDDLLVTVPTSVRAPRRGDVVVLAPGTLGPGPSVKRLVSTPGDRVVVLDGHVHTDGSWWTIAPATLVDSDHQWDPAPDEVVVLGDNGPRSTDSRAVGTVPVRAIERVALARLRPWRWLRGDMHRLPGARRRDAVRVVVLDPDDRTLLFRVADVDGVRPDWWETPGGGLQPGEDHARAAIREVAEEVGAPGVDVVDLDHVAQRDSTLWGVDLHRVEATFATRVTDDAVSTSGWTASERIDHQGWEWFTRDELAALDTVTHPAALVEVYDLAVAALGGRPA